jgi:hypothetical protein
MGQATPGVPARHDTGWGRVRTQGRADTTPAVATHEGPAADLTDPDPRARA